MDEVGAKVFDPVALRTLLVDHLVNKWFKLERQLKLIWV